MKHLKSRVIYDGMDTEECAKCGRTFHLDNGFTLTITCNECGDILKPSSYENIHRLARKLKERNITESYNPRLISRVAEAVELAETIFQDSQVNSELELLARLHQLQGYAEALIEPSNKTSGWEMPNPRDANKDPDIPMPNEYRKGGKINKA